MNRTFSCLIAALACLACGSAQAAILFQRSLVVDRSVNIFTTQQFDLELILADSFSSPTNPLKAFDAAVAPNAGLAPFELTPGDPGFDDVAARLTDGRDEIVQLVFAETASGRAEQRGWRESGFFLGLGSPTIPDLAGKVIESVQLKVEQFLLVFPNAAALAPVGPPVNLQLTFTVTGVPEPQSLALAVLALATVAIAAYTMSSRRHLISDL